VTKAIPGVPQQVVSPDELRAVAADGTKLRYRLMEMASEIDDVIALGRGDPDLDTPGHIVEAACGAIRDGRADLPSPVAGLGELRDAVARKLRRDNGIPVDGDGVLITSGSQEGLFLLIQGLIEPGDEIIVPDPRYTSYDQAIERAGGIIRLVPTHPEDNFDLFPEVVEEAITSRTKAILLVTPNNPTAGIVSPGNLEKIAGLAVERDLVLISDEIYERYVYPPGEHLSVASLPGLFERTITLGGVSKTYAMTGWRVGYVASPPKFTDHLVSLKRAVSGGTAAVSQYAALAALSGSQQCVSDFYRTYNRRREAMMRGLRDLGFDFGEPLGAFYVFTDVSSVGLSALEFSYLLLKEAHVLIFPGTAFGERWSDWMRISLLQPVDVIEEALRRIAGVLERHT
jgi:aspartate/methionine/tyrosine aminotransferase